MWNQFTRASPTASVADVADFGASHLKSLRSLPEQVSSMRLLASLTQLGVTFSNQPRQCSSLRVAYLKLCLREVAASVQRGVMEEASRLLSTIQLDEYTVKEASERRLRLIVTNNPSSM